MLKRLSKIGQIAVILTALLGPAVVYGANAGNDVHTGLCNFFPVRCNDNLEGNGGFFTLIANTLIFIIGAIAVIMVLIGAFRYVLSGGDPAGVKSAKDTILYAVIGIVVAILSFAIVNFVISRLIR